MSTTTAVARVSLGPGGPPVTRTTHSITVRARKTSGAGTVTLRAALYEGVNNRSGDLESTALTTSLADYTLSVSDASAAAITNYSDLEIRFWGFSSTNDTVNVEVADIYISTPTPAWVQTIPDNLALTDTQAFVQGIGRSQTISDNLGVTDQATTLRDGRVAIADNLALVGLQVPVLTIGTPVPDNPSFDTDLASWTLQPSSGSISRVTTGVIDTAPASLLYSVGADTSDITTHYLEETFSGAFRSGTQYTLSLRVFGSGAQAAATFRFGDNVLGDFVDTGQIVVGSASVFSTINISWTPATDTAQATLRIGFSNLSSNYRVDSLNLTSVADPNITRSLPIEALALTDTVARTATWVRALADALDISGTTVGSTLPSGTTGTPVARISLEAGSTPSARTGHAIKLRARKTSGTGTVTIRAALYEGAINRSGDLESSALTTSLADYTLAIPDVNAASITNYLDLELRVWGISTTGDTTNVEVADISLDTPPPGPGAFVLSLSESLAVTDASSQTVGPVRSIADSLAITDSASGGLVGAVIHSYRTEMGGFAPVFMLMPGARVSGQGTVTATGHQIVTGGTAHSQGINDALGVTDARVFLNGHSQVVSDPIAFADAVINQNTQIVVVSEQLSITDALSNVSVTVILIPDSIQAVDGINAIFAPGGVIFNQNISESLALTDTLFIPNLQHLQLVGDFINVQTALAYGRAFRIPDIFIIGDVWRFQGTAFVSIIDLIYPLSITIEAVPSLLATMQQANVMLLMPDIQFTTIEADEQYADITVNDIEKKLATIEDYIR